MSVSECAVIVRDQFTHGVIWFWANERVEGERDFVLDFQHYDHFHHRKRRYRAPLEASIIAVELRLATTVSQS